MMDSEIRNRLYEVNRVAAEFYHSYLMSERGEKALTYLKNRGLTLDTIQKFGMGASPDQCDGLICYLTEKGFSVSEMIQADLVRKSNDGSFFDYFRARIMFPIADTEGNIIAFCGKNFLNNSSFPTYINTGFTPIYDKGESLFGLNIAKGYGTEQIVLVEGIIDAIFLHQAGIKNVVAVLGFNLTERHAALLSKYTKKVVVCYDSDLLGQKGAKEATEILRNSNISVAAITLDDAMDPYNYVSKYGGEKLKELMDHAFDTIC